MTQVSSIQPQYQTYPKYVPTPPASYNAVKIDINNPQVNAPGYSQNQDCQQNCTAPIYDYPKAPIYDVPKQSIYTPKSEAPSATPPAVKEAPTVPPPVIVQMPTAVAKTTATEAPTENKTTDTSKVAVEKKIEVKTPEAVTPSVDINSFISQLTNPDYHVQGQTMASIAAMTKVAPTQATQLLDAKVVDALLNIMNNDTSKLEGPTDKQLSIRADILSGKQVSPADTEEANKITPKELAERNKQFAIYTVAKMDKLYSSEIEKLSKNVVPLTELPGAAGIVEQIKNNSNPMVRAAGIDGLSSLQRPEYKKDLSTLFTIAKNDQDSNVQNAATKALDKLATVPEPAAQKAPEAKTPVAPVQQAPAQKEKAEPVKA